MIRGQALAIERLEAFLDSSTPPSLLFLGQAGVGKKTLAVRFSSRLAEIPVKRIESGNSVDVRILDATTLKVAEAREIERQLRWNPTAAKCRISIIDNADEMSPSVYNSLLKILEEPPPTSYLILIASNSDSIPLTVRSRCHVVHFGTLSESDISSILVDDLKMAPESAQRIAAMSEGSMERAMWGYQGFYREDLSLVSGILASLRAGNLESVFVEIERWSDRQEVLRRLYIAYLYFRDCFVLETDRLFAIPQGSIPIKSATTACIKIQKAHESLSKNANVRVTLDNLMLDLLGVLN